MPLDKDVYARLLKAVRTCRGEQILQEALQGVFGHTIATWGGDDRRAEVRVPLTSYGKLTLTPETVDAYMIGKRAGVLFSAREQQYNEMHKWLLIFLGRGE